LECFLELSKKYKNINLKLVARGDYHKQIRSFLSKNDKAHKVKLIKDVPPNRIGRLLDASDVGLVSLLTDDQNPACNKIPDTHQFLQHSTWLKSKSVTKMFEYMAYGLPVIITRGTDADHRIKDRSEGFFISTKEEFIKRMETLIRNPILKEKMGKRARKKVERDYSLDALGEKLCEKIQETFQI
jgi:glycosyltransferase involved in cell wall biosynthesis